MELESLIESAAVRVRGDLQFSGGPIPPRAGLERFSRDRNKMNGFLKLFCAGGIPALLIAMSFCGCITKAQARAQAQAAYLAGQRDALAKMAADQHASVYIVGPVQKTEVPWVEGLTLAQAIATANYTSRHSPKEITITRQGERASINPKDLLNGRVVPLEPGDTIILRE
jgi:hypothetical protein